mmetsp:Transcript_40267/g.95669  ORF Transcript_40267/g.95669 Transcript_40267/m.95669 type:complete len:251 (+) Transcript_40267:2026-2778(+)
MSMCESSNMRESDTQHCESTKRSAEGGEDDRKKRARTEKARRIARFAESVQVTFRSQLFPRVRCYTWDFLRRLGVGLADGGRETESSLEELAEAAVEAGKEASAEGFLRKALPAVLSMPELIATFKVVRTGYVGDPVFLEAIELVKGPRSSTVTNALTRFVALANPALEEWAMEKGLNHTIAVMGIADLALRVKPPEDPSFADEHERSHCLFEAVEEETMAKAVLADAELSMGSGEGSGVMLTFKGFKPS